MKVMMEVRLGAKTLIPGNWLKIKKQQRNQFILMGTQKTVKRLAMTTLIHERNQLVVTLTAVRLQVRTSQNCKRKSYPTVRTVHRRLSLDSTVTMNPHQRIEEIILSEMYTGKCK
eukprot:PhF_6_TR20857/c0_g1_i1/m.30066